MNTANLLTAKQALDKQCRQAVYVVPMGASIAPGQIAWAFPNCSGPNCCHWRWHESPDDFARGACGLAGQP